MGIPGELWETVRKLSALEARTEDALRTMLRIEAKVDNLIDRISRVEARYEQLRENVRNEILADMKADLARVQVLLVSRTRNSQPKSASHPRTWPGAPPQA